MEVALLKTRELPSNILDNGINFTFDLFIKILRIHCFYPMQYKFETFVFRFAISAKLPDNIEQFK